MSNPMMYYLAWEEDDWLDELLDRFPEVNAHVPTAKTFAELSRQRRTGEVERAVLVLNASQEKEKCHAFLRMCMEDERLSQDPLYIVGLKPEEEQDWREMYPHAEIVVITGFVFTFDYDAVLDRMERDLEGA